MLDPTCLITHPLVQVVKDNEYGWGVGVWNGTELVRLQYFDKKEDADKQAMRLNGATSAAFEAGLGAGYRLRNFVRQLEETN